LNVRALIVSDIHANLVALEAVLRHARFDAVWCLGDTVGYGPQPVECIARMRELKAVWVAGNHERASTGAMGIEDFNPDAGAAALWTRERLSKEDKRFLDRLPEVHRQGPFTLVHGTLRRPLWEYLYSREIALAHLELQETPFSLVGHTHIPSYAVQEPERPQRCELLRLLDSETVELRADAKTVLNPGSAGQPRDGDPRASYALYDDNEQSVRVHRVEYDIKATQALMASAGLPVWLIQRLSRGR
jgi:diadenosine tetraphosphatase ApaH/serine/threonine PP2A family protein phosphatase